MRFLSRENYEFSDEKLIRLSYWKREAERTSFSNVRANFYAALVGLNDPLGNKKAQA